jgi:hypothetical protein
MSTHRNSQQIQIHFQEKMGDELGAVFYKIYNQVIFLHKQWYNYLELFGVDEKRIHVLNESASFFFFIVQKGLFENIIMSIARLTDPEKTGRYKNLSILTLPGLIQDEELKKEVALQIDWILLNAVAFAREWRMKKFAHSDYDISLGKATLQEEASKQNIKLALESIRNLLNSITFHYLNYRTYFENKDTTRGSKSLLSCLNDSMNLENYLKKLRIEGKELPEELLNR